MNKVVSLLPYINAKRKNNEQECLRDYIAEFEDLSFEIELEFDKDFNCAGIKFNDVGDTKKYLHKQIQEFRQKADYRINTKALN